MRKLITLGLILSGVSISACNTIEGIGRDVSAAGAAVSSSAKSARN